MHMDQLTPHFFVAETLKNGLYQLTFATSQVVKGVQHGGPMSSVIYSSACGQLHFGSRVQSRGALVVAAMVMVGVAFFPSIQIYRGGSLC